MIPTGRLGAVVAKVIFFRGRPLFSLTGLTTNLSMECTFANTLTITINPSLLLVLELKVATDETLSASNTVRVMLAKPSL